MAGQYNTTPPTLSDRAKAPLQLDASGSLRTVSSGSGATADQVQGTAVSHAAAVGNPVLAGAIFHATYPNLDTGDVGTLRVDSQGWLQVAPGSVISPVDGWGNASGFAHVRYIGGANPGLNGNLCFNGTTWDRARGDTNGAVVQSGLSSTFWNYAAASGGIDNTTTAVTIKSAAGANVRNYLKTLTIEHDTLGAATEIAIRDGAGGTVLWRGKLQTTAHPGRSITFDPPLKGTANTLLEVVTLTAVTGDVLVNATGFTGA